MNQVPVRAGNAGAVPIRRRRRPLHWLLSAVVLLLLAMFANLVVTGPGWQWDVVFQYAFDPQVLQGVGRTLVLTVSAMAVSLIAGTAIGMMSFSDVLLLRLINRAYVWVFRAIPPLVLVLFMFYVSALLPRVSLGIPFGPEFLTVPTNDLITQFTAALLGLALAESAYIAEIVRGGVLAVDQGQVDAGRAMGMRPGQIIGRIVLPQSIRVIIPPLGNEVIGLLKGTSLVIVIGYAELLTSVQYIYAQNFQQIPLLLVATGWYLLLTSLAILGQGRLEKHFSRSAARRTAL